MYANPSNVIDTVIALLERNRERFDSVIRRYNGIGHGLTIFKGMRKTLPVSAYPSFEIEPSQENNDWATTRGQRPRMEFDCMLTVTNDNDNFGVEYISSIIREIKAILTSPENLQMMVKNEFRWDNMGQVYPVRMIDSFVNTVDYNTAKSGTLRVATFTWWCTLHETFPEEKWARIVMRPYPIILQPSYWVRFGENGEIQDHAGLFSGDDFQTIQPVKTNLSLKQGPFAVVPPGQSIWLTPKALEKLPMSARKPEEGFTFSFRIQADPSDAPYSNESQINNAFNRQALNAHRLHPNTLVEMLGTRLSQSPDLGSRGLGMNADGTTVITIVADFKNFFISVYWNGIKYQFYQIPLTWVNPNRDLASVNAYLAQNPTASSFTWHVSDQLYFPRPLPDEAVRWLSAYFVRITPTSRLEPVPPHPIAAWPI